MPNYVAGEIESHFGEAEHTDDVVHYGTKRHSGRYPWGSGENPYQHSGDFLSRVEELHAAGMTEKEIADAIGLSTTDLRAYKAVAKSERRSLEVAQAKSLRADGKSLNEIAKIMGYKNDSSVRSLLDEDSERRMNQAQATADVLKKMVSEKGMLDVGDGAERELGVGSREKFAQALAILEAEGYPVYTRGIAQVTNPGRQTITPILCPPGTEYKEVYDTARIHSVGDYISLDGGESFKRTFEYPASMDSSRLQVRYAEDGGINKDGVLEIRPGVKDLSLGNSAYAQVRVLVDDTHYLKGMAVYGDPKDFPDGVDVIFNTNKKRGTPVTGSKDNTVLKPIKKDPDNPFGALLRDAGGQTYYDDPDGKYEGADGQKQSLSLINKTRQEGDWGDWSRELPSQFLAKQRVPLIEKQLALTVADRQTEFDEILSLTNPTLRKKLLQEFASECDSAAVHLKAASLPRQAYQVILPLTTLKEGEVFAPQYNDGETVALVRFPHEGIYQIPILKVNNKNKEGLRMITNSAADAVGISSTTAEKLSGADFDGDTVLVIPCNSESSSVRIQSKNTLKGLEGFDSKQYKFDKIVTDEHGVDHYYRNGEEFRPMANPSTGKDNTQNEMGRISNLIMDMTLKGASESELARATKHAMVVIDAAKHGLDYKASERENGIDELKQKWQAHEYDEKYGGAGTLITRAKSEQRVLKRQGSPKINQKGKSWYDESKPEGALVYKEVVEQYTDAKGKTHTREQVSTKMAETTDARTLISAADTPQERLYAKYANSMKDLANRARMAQVKTGGIKVNAEAKAAYSTEREHLLSQLTLAKSNAPRERYAQILANTRMEAKRQANPDMTTKEKKKLAQQELTSARIAVGAQRHKIEISDREWEAIQSGALSDSQLMDIFRFTDTDVLRERATPKLTTGLSAAKQAKIEAMKNAGYTIADIAKAVGVSTSTVNQYLKK